MTMREIVNKLRIEGHSVDFYVRKDGGILIRSIDGINYPKGATGNRIARQMANQTISERRKTQLKRIMKKAGRKSKKPPLPPELDKKLKSVQRTWRKKVDVEKTGQPTISKLRWRLENKGYKEAVELLNEWERYTAGIAYSEIVNALADEVLKYYKNTGEVAFEELSNEIKANKDTIRDEWIKPAYDALYQLNNGGDIQQIINEVRLILRLP